MMRDRQPKDESLESGNQKNVEKSKRKGHPLPKRKSLRVPNKIGAERTCGEVNCKLKSIYSN